MGTADTEFLVLEEGQRTEDETEANPALRERYTPGEPDLLCPWLPAVWTRGPQLKENLRRRTEEPPPPQTYCSYQTASDEPGRVAPNRLSVFRLERKGQQHLP